MNEHIKQTWIAALRDGGTKKAKAQLKDCDGYLSPGGILCELAVQAGIIEPPTDLTSKTGRKEAHFFGWLYDGEGVGIPDSVAKWAEVTYRAVWRLDYKSDCGLSFDEIADLVKEW